MKEVTQFKTVTKYFLDKEGYLYGRDGKMKSTTILTIDGPKTMTRDKWYAIVYLDAPIDKKIFTFRNYKNEVEWRLKQTWKGNFYDPSVDDFQKTYIYFLYDKKDGLPRYIGKTVDTKKRLRDHITSSLRKKSKPSHKVNWIRDVYNNNSEIDMCVIDETNPDGSYGSGDWTWLEMYWGNQFISWGFDIIFDGGWGTGGNRRNLTDDEKLRYQTIHAELSGKPVYLYELYTDNVLTFNAKRDACRFLVNNGYCEQRKKLYDGLFIKGEYLVKENLITQKEKIELIYNTPQIDLKVLKMSMDFSEVIEEYPSLRDAQRKNNGGQIAGVLNKSIPKRKSSLGFRWVYKLDYVYKGVDYLKDLYGFKRDMFTYTEDLINDCLNPNLTYKMICEKHKGVSKGTVGNIKKDPEKYRKKIGLKSYSGNHKKIF